MIRLRAAALGVLLLGCVPGVAAGASRRSGGNFDYPAAAFREGREGTAYFRTTIGVDGRAKDCVITQSSGHADLDSETCRVIIVRGRWTAAKNAAGEPIESSYAGKIDWKIGR